MIDPARLRDIPRDLLSGLVVFLVALPLCLGIALASGAPVLSGIIAGAVGGIVVGLLSGSQISVSGPAAGLSAVVLSLIARLGGDHGGFEAFLLCVVLAGVFQVLFGALRAGFFANYIPTNVIRGLLAAIGLIIILKQAPGLIGYSPSQGVTLSFFDLGGGNTFSNLFAIRVLPGAMLIGLVSVALILAWENTRLKKLPLPSALLAVIAAVALNEAFVATGSPLAVTGTEHLIHLPTGILESPGAFLRFPDFSRIGDSAVLVGALTLAAVASLETLLNLEAADKFDPRKRVSPPNRELFAQGAGNIASGLLGGLPVTSVIIRSSVNATAGARTRLSAIFHGVLLVLAILFLTPLLNRIPLAALAAILVVTGFKLASPRHFVTLYREGWNQFLPFIFTIAAILFTDLLLGIMIGLGVSIAFILHNNLRRGIHVVKEHHALGKVTRLELPEQVTFLNRAVLADTFERLPSGANVVIDARTTDYIDPDIHALILKFRDEDAPARGIVVSLLGFKNRYDIEDTVQFIDVSPREQQARLTPARALDLLREGNERFVKGERLYRDLARQMNALGEGRPPLAAILACSDARASTELIFDLGLGDIYSIRLAGNIPGPTAVGSMEFACLRKGAKVILVLGHTDCDAVAAACERLAPPATPPDAGDLDCIAGPIAGSARAEAGGPLTATLTPEFVDRVSARNVRRTLAFIRANSPALRDAIGRGEVALVGGMYDVKSGKVDFFAE